MASKADEGRERRDVTARTRRVIRGYWIDEGSQSTWHQKGVIEPYEFEKKNRTKYHSTRPNHSQRRSSPHDPLDVRREAEIPCEAVHCSKQHAGNRGCAK